MLRRHHIVTAGLAVILLAGGSGCEDDESSSASPETDLVLDAYRALEALVIDGACGPSGVAWVYAGLPGAAESPRDIAAYVERHYTRPIMWNGEELRYMRFADLRAALEDVTDGAWTLEELGAHRWETARAWLQRHQLPLFSLDLSGSVWHWRVVYGVRRDPGAPRGWYCLHDNGARGGTWLEADDGIPFADSLYGVRLAE